MKIDTVFLYRGKDYFAITCDCGKKFELEAGKNWIEKENSQLAICPKCKKQQPLKDVK